MIFMIFVGEINENHALLVSSVLRYSFSVDVCGKMREVKMTFSSVSHTRWCAWMVNSKVN